MFFFIICPVSIKDNNIASSFEPAGLPVFILFISRLLSESLHVLPSHIISCYFKKYDLKEFEFCVTISMSYQHTVNTCLNECQCSDVKNSPDGAKF